ncbi:ABC transporter permease [Leifsonia xyli subsp. xyli]|uniref:ABC transporter, integral membrane subunit n=2 Tax=Leifsonia xyli subsp. xyli TaxID=59736 RepID=Q6AFS6_LEIXX|nr:ABC transporter permease subunit [Leifsonia xyli]AAT88769.1 ABC transporter, integral membrane subunit [Leifsonia xyli subsp. xyli str. CTCB07]ODA89482.1 ABC transporter permease [Leifsonia xyli subsp. xyli]
MTTTTAPVHSSLGRLSFPRVIGSEWIKLRSLRSTFWTLASVIVIVIGFSALLSVTIPSAETLRQQLPGTRLDGFVSAAATTGLTFAQLVVAVLGVLVISGEFSTGMIRSSFAAVPRRFPTIAAKAITLFLVSFIVGLVSFAASWAIAAVVMSAKGYQADLFAGSTLWSILGAAVYLGLVAVFSMGLGTILKASGGGIAAAVGALFVLPIIASIVVGLLPDAKWLTDAQHYLISNAGSGMAGLANDALEPWANAVTVLVWTAVSFAGGALLLQRRDA